MLKPNNKKQLLELLKIKNFTILLVDENHANIISEQIRRFNSKKVTVIVLN